MYLLILVIAWVWSYLDSYLRNKLLERQLSEARSPTLDTC